MSFWNFSENNGEAQSSVRKLVGALIEERDTEIMRSGVGYVIFKGSFVDFYLRCCGFVCLLL